MTSSNLSTRETCDVCGGEGWIEFDYGTFVQLKPCDYCDGQGHIGDEGEA
jgi:DnaJ-class molecular chaperone